MTHSGQSLYQMYYVFAMNETYVPSELVGDQFVFANCFLGLSHTLQVTIRVSFPVTVHCAEPYAFSKKLKTKWRLPKFNEVKFSFSEDDQVLKTSLKKWWDKQR